MAILKDDELRKYAEQKAEEFNKRLMYLASKIGKSVEECCSDLSSEANIIKTSANNKKLKGYTPSALLGGVFHLHEAASIAIKQGQFYVLVDNFISISQGLTMAEMLIDKKRLMRQCANIGVEKHPKQKEKLLLKKEWENWQVSPSDYKTKTDFARDMLTNYPLLKSEKVITDWCRQWEKEV